MVWELLIIFESLGKVLVDEVTGSKLLKIGALPEGEFGCPAAPRSNSSQQYVKGLPLGSTAEPVKEKGVLIGIENPPEGTVTVGASFPVFVTTGHVLPEPRVVYATISSILIPWK